MKQIKATSFAGIQEAAMRRQRIYEALSPEEKAEIDEFNKRIAGKSVVEILAECKKQPDGKHPFYKYEKRSKL